ncbi:DUF4012 domain-containing protein [Nocardioidaceae bacterium]|nr:DUF4012 domain-containing protein [Nocardioidaceae bacterium]
MRVVRWSLLAIVLVVLGALGWAGWTGIQAAEELRTASVATDRLTSAVRDGRIADAREDLAEVRTNARDAADHVSGPVWATASVLPSIGDDVTAVREAADLVADAAEGVGTDLLAVVTDLEPGNLIPTDGRIDLDPLAAAAPRLDRASTQLVDLGARARGIDLAGVRPIIADPLATLKEEITRIEGITGEAATAARLLPPMLGSEERRRYLLLVQNNAELRATGGIPGAYAELRADDGRLRLGEQGSAQGLGNYDEPVVPLTDEEQAIYGDILGQFAQDVNLTPRFPRSGELAAAMWADTHDTEVDGVASVDPVALSYLLRATGPVTVELPDGETVELTADNVVPYLLNQVYLDNPDDPARQDAVFATAAGAVFDAVTAGGADPRALLDALTRAVTERRLLLWSTRQAEQAEIARAPIAGDLDGSQDANPYVGVFFNNASGSKLDFYLESEVTTRSIRCEADGSDRPRQRVEVAVTLTSRVPEDPSPLGAYILGLSRPRGFNVTNLYVYFPTGSTVLADEAVTEKTSAQGKTTTNPSTTDEHTDGGFPVQVFGLGLDPGQTGTITIPFLAPPGLTGPVDLQVTPQVRPVPVEIGRTTC